MNDWKCIITKADNGYILQIDRELLDGKGDRVHYIICETIEDVVHEMKDYFAEYGPEAA